MGCDVHSWVETRTRCPEEGWVGEWQLVIPSWECRWCRGSGQRYESKCCESKCYFCRGTGEEHSLQTQNYSLFAILADVRNGWPAKLPIISEPRGLPIDMSIGLREHLLRCATPDPETRERYYDVALSQGLALPGEHSGSWVGLDEIERYLAEREDGFVKMTGLLDYDAWVKWEAAGARGSPRSYAGATSQRVLSRVEAYAHAGPKDFHVRVEWKEGIRSLLGEHFLGVIVPALRRLASNPLDVRLVFNFDS